MRRRFVQDRQSGKLHEIPPGGVLRRTPVTSVQSDAPPFVSPIDGRLISGNAALREHNREHNVVQHREYGEREGADYMTRMSHERDDRLQSQTRADKFDRIECLKRAFDQHRG